ncbi:MAG: NAD+ synthase [Syntrophorhabdales bacterium]|nr:NAD+ synthase [Syntrophorhabdales bacterium]
MEENGIYRVAVAQLNTTVGDLPGNYKKILEGIEMARALNVDIIAFPELTITGCPPEDLLLKPRFIEDNIDYLKRLSASVPDIVAIVGFVDRKGARIYNAASVLYDRDIKGVFYKIFLTNQGVFDEKRYFTPGDSTYVASYGGLDFGVSISEDIWHRHGPAASQAEKGARLVINISASPYYAGKIKLREEVIRRAAIENSVFIVYANLVGGQDEIVYDGQSFVMDCEGRIISRAAAFNEDFLVIDMQERELRSQQRKEITRNERFYAGRLNITETIKRDRRLIPIQAERPSTWDQEPSQEEEVYSALVLGLADYVRKNGFKKVVLGISGGIDSALVATLAVDALGRENVIGIFMPSRFTSEESRKDTIGLASNLGIKLHEVPIDDIYAMYLVALKPFFEGLKEDATEENIQARIRGNIVMAFSNKFKWLVLTTGNKSEMSVGYATLYGDMAGGFAVIKDVPKTMVYKLCAHRNTKGAVIPENILKKEPTAELRADQKDTDSLPPYEILDPILKMYIEDDWTVEDIIKNGIDERDAERVVKMVDTSEYKRRQSPPGIKITPKAFGKDRRMPITNKYRLW